MGELPVPPSGRQFVIRYAAQAATVVEGGGGLRTYTLDGVDLIDGYDQTRDVQRRARAGARPVAEPDPWRALQLGRTVPVNETDKGNAIHGLVRWRGWQPREVAAERVVLGLRLLPMPGYPFALDLAATYSLDGQGLTVATTARNVGATAAPYGYVSTPT